MAECYYSILKIPKNASDDEIKKGTFCSTFTLINTDSMKHEAYDDTVVLFIHSFIHSWHVYYIILYYICVIVVYDWNLIEYNRIIVFLHTILITIHISIPLLLFIII